MRYINCMGCIVLKFNVAAVIIWHEIGLGTTSSYNASTVEVRRVESVLSRYQEV